MVVNDPETLAEVEAAFSRYETALVSNDVETLDALFWQDERTIRYGIGENLHGVSEILAFRKGRSPKGLERDLDRTVITTFGSDFATASTLFRRDGAPGKIGRQMQSWVRMDDGWRVVAAHVSIIDEEK
ncbi:oxalurate catabolism protein HpxZ [Oricola indica]|uniref:oxalurate catabolism protein HpxZ n=1 Tax=Oricola indica TaxID=2872591 RepID=UPI003CCC01B8